MNSLSATAVAIPQFFLATNRPRVAGYSCNHDETKARIFIRASFRAAGSLFSGVFKSTAWAQPTH